MPGFQYCGNGVCSPSIGGGKMMDNPCNNCPKRQRCTSDKMCSRWKSWFREHWQEAQRLWQELEETRVVRGGVECIGSKDLY